MSKLLMALLQIAGVGTVLYLLAGYLRETWQEMKGDVRTRRALRDRKRPYRPLVTVIIEDDTTPDHLRMSLQSIVGSSYTKIQIVAITSARVRTTKLLQKIGADHPGLQTKVVSARTKSEKTSTRQRTLAGIKGSLCMYIVGGDALDATALEDAVRCFVPRQTHAVLFQERVALMTSLNSAFRMLTSVSALWNRRPQRIDFYQQPLLVSSRLLKQQKVVSFSSVRRSNAVVYTRSTHESPQSLWTRLAPLLVGSLVMLLAMEDRLVFAYAICLVVTALTVMTVLEFPKLRLIDRLNLTLLAPLLWGYLVVAPFTTVAKRSVR